MFDFFIYNYGFEIIGLILSAVLGCLGYAAKRIYQTHVNDETKRSIARVVVQFVEPSTEMRSFRRHWKRPRNCCPRRVLTSILPK